MLIEHCSILFTIPISFPLDQEWAHTLNHFCSSFRLQILSLAIVQFSLVKQNIVTTARGDGRAKVVQPRAQDVLFVRKNKQKEKTENKPKTKAKCGHNSIRTRQSSSSSSLCTENAAQKKKSGQPVAFCALGCALPSSLSFNAVDDETWIFVVLLLLSNKQLRLSENSSVGDGRCVVWKLLNSSLIVFSSSLGSCGRTALFGSFWANNWRASTHTQSFQSTFLVTCNVFFLKKILIKKMDKFKYYQGKDNKRNCLQLGRKLVSLFVNKTHQM